MTVEEVIELLSEFPQEKEVFIDECFYNCPFDEVSIREEETMIVIE